MREKREITRNRKELTAGKLGRINYAEKQKQHVDLTTCASVQTSG